jgi:nucleoside-diphosphate-sugar epimerase
MYDTSDRVIPLFIRLTLNDQDLVVFGEDKLLDFTYIDDTIAGVIKCIERFPVVKNNTFNFAYGRSVPVIEVAYLIRNSMNGKNTIVIKENRKGEVIRSAIDITKAKKHLEYEPVVPIEEGVLRSIRWYIEYYSRTGKYEDKDHAYSS